jgi:hypothetical protein
MKRSRLIAARHQIALHSVGAPEGRGRGSRYGRASNSLRACPQRQKFNRRDVATPFIEVIPVSKRANLLVIRLAAAFPAAGERLEAAGGARKARAAAVAFFPGRTG